MTRAGTTEQRAEMRARVILRAAEGAAHVGARPGTARSIARDLRDIGEEVWGRFSAPKAQTLWYYRSLVTRYRGNPAHTPALIDELDRTVTEMETLAR